MDINHLAVLSARISRYIGRMLVVFCLLLGLVFLVYLQPAEQKSLSGQRVPQSHNEALLLKVDIQHSIDEILHTKPLADIVVRHHGLIQQLIEFNTISDEPSLADVIKRLNDFNDTVLLIQGQQPKNTEFLNDMKAQVQRVLIHLNTMLSELSAQQYLLNERIYNVNNGDPKAPLFQAYLELSEQTDSYQMLSASLVIQQQFLEELSAFSSLSYFDEHMAKLKNDLLLWEQKSSYLLNQASPFNDVYQPFSQQVFSVENGMGNWRTSLQNTQAYFRFLQAEKPHIWQLAYVLPPLNPDPLHVSNYLERINEVFKNHEVLWQGESIQLSVDMVRVTLYVLMGLCLALLIFYGISCRYCSAQMLKIKLTNKPDDNPELEEIIDISPSLDEEHRLNTTQIEVLSEELHQLKLQNLANNEQLFEQKAILDKKQSLVVELEKNNQALTLAHENAITEYQNKQQELAHKNRQMVVRTLLQSQSASIGTGGNTLQVYRHLTRMFDWCNQLATPLQESTPSVAMYNELSAAMYQMMLEAHWQRNTLWLNIGTDISNAQVDGRLFQRMLVSVGRLLLLDQFKSTLTLNVNAATMPATNHNLMFEFIVVADKNRKKTPSLVQELFNLQQNSQSSQPEALTYIYQILKVLNAINLSAQQNDLGYTFSFELPRNNQEPLGANITQVKIDAQLIALTGQPELINVLEKHRQRLETKLVIVNSSEDAQNKSLFVPTNKPVVFLLAEDCYDKEFDSLYRFVSEQALTNNYKIMVLQSSYHCAMQRQGLYQQALSPIFPDTFSTELQALIVNKEITNLCVSPEVMSQHQYQTSQVEVLFFSHQVARYQTLIRVLHWLGLQVNVVANAETMKPAWQSGRYLIFITDIAETPFIELAAGKTIKRAVFTLGNSHKKKKKITLAQMKTWSLQCQEAKSWLLEELAPLDDIKGLVKQLSPWLKAKEREILVPLPENQKALKPQLAEKSKVAESQTVKTRLTSASPSAGDEVSQGLPNSKERGAFNLTDFANNQGSPELAVYMLDIYLEELSDLQEKLTCAINDKDYGAAQALLSSIMLIAMIMSASPLQQAGESLAKALNANNANDVSGLLMILSSCLEELMTFSADI